MGLTVPPPTNATQVLPQERLSLSRPQVICTAKNIFSLYRQYMTAIPPAHDPEEGMNLDDLSNIPPSKQAGDGISCHPFGPYPNFNSFRIGDWYWGQTQKSQEDFRALVNIIGDIEFQSSDVRHTRWDYINKQLAGDSAAGWMDEEFRNADWTCSEFSITVPFHRRTQSPGPQTYQINGFYHWKLVSVIRERLVNNSQFHFDPYELHWQVGENSPPVRVYGEIYTAAAFLRAHRELQDSPPVPGCDLPRVVTALMFWSDATHLASFGDAMLWPLYMFFGNESKYRRCKPSQQLCSHVAYFQKVSSLFVVSRHQHLAAVVLLTQ